MAAIPLESSTLHYSKLGQLSLDPKFVFDKIVTGRRGGSFIEANPLFAIVLRTRRFDVTSIGKTENGYNRWCVCLLCHQLVQRCLC